MVDSISSETDVPQSPTSDSPSVEKPQQGMLAKSRLSFTLNRFSNRGENAQQLQVIANKVDYPLSIEKNNLINLFKLTIKSLIDSSISSGRILSSSNYQLQQFMLIIEQILQHGMFPAKTTPNLTGYCKHFWAALDRMDKMSNNCTEILQSIRFLPDIKTGVGRGRAWIRYAIMQKRLADYFEILAMNNNQLTDLYRPEAFLLDEDSLAVMSGTLKALNVLEYNFVPKEEDLDNIPTVICLTPFLKDGNYLEQQQLPPPIYHGSDDEEGRGDVRNGANSDVIEELQQTVTELSDQKNYLDEVNKKLRCQYEEALSKNVTCETEKMEISFKLEGLELDLNKIKSEHEKLRMELAARDESVKRRVESAEADIAVERETIKGMNQSLDDLYQQTKQKLADEITRRLEVEKEAKLQMSMRQETEMATKLLENDIHEKQDMLVSLRQQLADIKLLNIQLFNTSQERQTKMEHQTELMGAIEEKSLKMNDKMKQLENDNKILDRDRIAALDTLKRLGSQISDKDKTIGELQSDLEIEREWRTTLQKEKEKFVAEIDRLTNQNNVIPSLKKELEKCVGEIEELTRWKADYEQSLADMGSKMRLQEEKLDEYREEEAVARVEVMNKRWVDDRFVKQCPACNQSFSATLRKHHCRNCGNVFCHNCSVNRVKLPIAKDPVRVCNECHPKILQSVAVQ